MLHPFCRPFSVLLALAGVGCAHVPGVSSETLPLTRVVIYRHGVAYFERSGKVHDSEVEFKVKPDHVGDFLATLAVMERGGSSVRSASFPIRLEEEEKGPPADGGERKKAGSALKTVKLKLDGGRHDLRVGYVSEQPVWKPSYRLVFEQGRPMLQAWGIVQNLSGEDWKDVQLSLVAGAPIAFASTLATPVTPQRPVVNDSGEVISAVPHGENVLEQRPPPPAPLQPSPVVASSASQAESARPASKSKKADRGPSRASSVPGMDTRKALADEDAPAEPSPSSVPRTGALLSTVQVQGGSTRYDLPVRVTLPNQSATMVLVLSKQVPGESVFMYAPEGGVPDSSRHPFRVVRFTNDTPGLLERGPIAVMESGAFLGQGVLEPLAAGAEATVPFALERAIAVQSEQKWDTQGARLAKIEAGALTLERDQSLRTTYRVSNGQDQAARVMVRHARTPGMRLHTAPPGTKDRLGMGSALVPVESGAFATSEAVVDERRAFSQASEWMSEEAGQAVKAYFEDSRADAKLAASLKRAWTLRESLRTATLQRAKVDGERAIVAQAAQDVRQNLTALRRNPGSRVDDLRQKLATRLTTLDKRNAELTQRAVELELEQNELSVRFNDGIRELHLAQPLPPPRV